MMMVSPKKRVEQILKSPQPQAEGIQNNDPKHCRGGNLSGSAKPRKSINSVFATKKFYLDLKAKNLTCPAVKQVVSDLQTLGGTIEEFFSRDVTNVISDAPESKLRGAACSKAPSAAATTVTVASTAGPTTPGGLAPSPCTSVSLQGAANSPWSPLSVDDSKKIPVARSRAESILDRARQQQTSRGRSTGGGQGVGGGGGTGLVNSGADVLEKATRLGLQIWSLPKVFNWLEAFKKRFGTLKRVHDTTPINRGYVNTRSQSVDTGLQTRNLTAPYIKFEVTNHMYKPVCQEFKRFPVLHFSGRPGSSPFTTPDNVKNKARKQFKERQVENRAIVQNQMRSVEQSASTVKPTQPAAAAVVSRRHNQGGFCEICECPFTDLYEHLSSRIHQHRVAGEDLWAKLDVCINKVNQVQSEEEEFNPQFSF